MKLLPEANGNGNYRFPDTSGILKSADYPGQWYVWKKPGESILDDDGTIKYFPTPEDAARALQELGLGPCSLPENKQEEEKPKDVLTFGDGTSVERVMGIYKFKHMSGNTAWVAGQEEMEELISWLLQHRPDLLPKPAEPKKEYHAFSFGQGTIKIDECRSVSFHDNQGNEIAWYRIPREHMQEIVKQYIMKFPHLVDAKPLDESMLFVRLYDATSEKDQFFSLTEFRKIAAKLEGKPS